MARYFSCLCKKGNVDSDVDISPHLHQTSHRQNAGNMNRIASPAKLVALGQQHDISGTKQDTHRAQNVEIERQDEIASNQELSLGPELTINSQAHTESEVQINSQGHMTPQLRKEDTYSRRNLWEVAEQRMDEKEKIWLKPESSQPMKEVIENIQKEAKMNYKQLQAVYIQNKETKQDKSGARKKFENLLRCTLQAESCIGAVLKLDATGYGKTNVIYELLTIRVLIDSASMAWTVVSFGLTVRPQRPYF